MEAAANPVVPRHLWIVGALALLWNSFGCFDYLMTQTANEAYFRVSGNWTFRFVGQLAAGTQTTFDVTTPLSVNALAPDAPAPTDTK